MHKLRCRPSDLAVTVLAENLEKIGAVVEVVGPADASVKLRGVPGLQWWVWAMGRPQLHLFRGGRVERVHERPAPDAFLRTTRRRETLPVDIAVVAMPSMPPYSDKDAATHSTDEQPHKESCQ